MTLRFPLGFQETYVCLMSPESPQLLCRGASWQQREERLGFIPGRVISIGEQNQLFMVSLHGFPNTTPHSKAKSESNATASLNKQALPPNMSSEIRPQLNMASETKRMQHKITHPYSTLVPHRPNNGFNAAHLNTLSRSNAVELINHTLTQHGSPDNYVPTKPQAVRCQLSNA